MNVVLAIIILVVYTLTLCIVGKQIPSSLSASVFNIPIKYRWVWTVVIYAVCFLCIPTIIEKSSVNTQFLAFIAIAALGFVGAAPLVKNTDDIAYKVHCGAAIVCAVCSQILLGCNNAWLLLCWIPWFIVFVWETKDTHKWRTITFWAEMVCFGSTFIYCLI